MHLLSQPFGPIMSFIYRDMIKSMLSKNKKPSIMTNYLSGYLAGALSVFTIYPLHYLKIRLSMEVGVDASQSVNSSKISEKQFKNARDCISQTRQHNGVRGFYKGIPMMFSGIVVYRTAYFGLYDTFKSYGKSSMFMTWIIAQSVTILASAISYPIDTIRNRLIMQN